MFWLIAGIILAIGLVVGLLIFINYKNNARLEDYKDKMRDCYRHKSSNIDDKTFAKQYEERHGKPKLISKGYAFLGIFALVIVFFGCIASV